jgi:hypothetical protein
MSTYHPSISEGFVPEDGGWTKDGGKDVLLLSVPELKESVALQIKSLDYAWLFDQTNDAYILCFRLNRESEYAIIFHSKHAGRLLLDAEAYETFNVAITSQSFEHIHDETPYLYLPNITVSRQAVAGW